MFFLRVQNVRIQNISVPASNGLLETINQMNNLEKLSFENPTFLKFVADNFLMECTKCVPEKIWKFIKENFRYKKDNYDETIAAPYVLLNTRTGDCDDFALFAKTILDILGSWKTNYLLLGRKFKQYTHVVVQAERIGNVFTVNEKIIIDGANEQFNFISNDYKFRQKVL